VRDARRASERAHQQWARTALDITHAAGMSSAPSAASHAHSICNIDILLKHSDATVAIYKKKTDETLAKTPEKHVKTIANICNIRMKHLQTYV
jgi:hypothetical protein